NNIGKLSLQEWPSVTYLLFLPALHFNSEPWLCLLRFMQEFWRGQSGELRKWLCRFWKQKQRASCLARCFVSSEGRVPIRLRYRPSETSSRARLLDWGRSHWWPSAAASRCC